MNLGKTFKELCTPAMVYLAISIITIFVALFNGVTIMIVAVKAIFVLFWTIILNLLCKNGMKYVSWFLVLLPYVLIFIGILMNVGNKREGARNIETKEIEKAKNLAEKAEKAYAKAVAGGAAIQAAAIQAAAIQAARKAEATTLRPWEAVRQGQRQAQNQRQGPR